MSSNAAGETEAAAAGAAGGAGSASSSSSSSSSVVIEERGLPGYPEDIEHVELPAEIEVHDPLSLTAEVTRLCGSLASVSSSAWTVRVACLKRVSRMQGNEVVNRCENFVDEMWRLRQGIVEQLSDRRSQVVKQACATIATLSTQFKALYSEPSGAAALSAAQLAHAQAIWMNITIYFIDRLLPLIPITVQVINSSACLCLSGLLKNVACVYREPPPLGSPAAQASLEEDVYPVMHHVLEHGCTHKHAIVRDHCFRGISKSMIRLDKRYIAREAALDAAAAAPAAASSPASAAASASSSSLLFSTLESTILTGIGDSHDKTRAAARICLIQLKSLAPARAEHILAAMNATQLKAFRAQEEVYETNRSLGPPLPSRAIPVPASKHNIADEQPRNASDDELEAELNPQAAPAVSVAQKGKTKPGAKAAAGASGISSLKAAMKGKKKSAFAAGGNEDVLVLEPSEEQRAAAAKHRDEADEESAPEPTAGSKKNKKSKKPKKHAGSKSDSSDEASHGDDEDGNHSDHAEETRMVTASSASSASVSTALTTNDDRNFLLLTRLLDLDTPTVTPKMIDFLTSNDGVLDVFIQFVVRFAGVMPPTDSLQKHKRFDDFGCKYHNVYEDQEQHMNGTGEESEPRPEWSDVPITHRARPHTSDALEQTAVRRSYHVMQILTAQRQTQSLLAVLFPRLSYIFLRFMFVFHPGSSGNIYHAAEILRKLVTTFTFPCIAALCTTPGKVLMNQMFDHLHEPPVIPLLLQFVQLSVELKVNNPLVPHDVVKALTSMDSLNFKCVPRIVNHPCTSRLVSHACCEFIAQYLEKVQALTDESHAAHMADFLAEMTTDGRIVELMSSALIDKSVARPAWQLANMSQLLLTLTRSVGDETIQVTDAPDAQQQALAAMLGGGSGNVALVKKMPNPLFTLRKLMLDKMREFIPGLCKLLTAGDRSGEKAASATGAAAASAASAPDSSSPSTSPTSPDDPLHMKFSSYTIVSFTSRRLQTLRILLQCIRMDVEQRFAQVEQLRDILKKHNLNTFDTPVSILCSPRMFSAIPAHTWHTLIEWFFRYTHNNFFLGAFKQLILCVIKYAVAVAKEKQREASEHAAAHPHAPPSPSISASCVNPAEETLKFLLGEQKFLHKMVAFYMHGNVHGAHHAPPAAAAAAAGTPAAPAVPRPPACATSAYILELLNHFRLAADVLPAHSFLWNTLQSIQQWHSILPIIKAEANKQAHNLHQKPVADGPSFASENPEERASAIERALFRLNGGGGGEGGGVVNPNSFVIPDGYTSGIDLGSVWAYHMGWTEKHGLEGEKHAGGAGAGGAAKKKKKKNPKAKAKKKESKAKKAAAAAAGGGAAGDDDHDGGDDSGDDGDDLNETENDSNVSSPATPLSASSVFSAPVSLKDAHPITLLKASAIDAATMSPSPPLVNGAAAAFAAHAENAVEAAVAAAAGATHNAPGNNKKKKGKK